MKVLIVALNLSLIVGLPTNAQYIPDSEFQWGQNKDCMIKDPNMEIFVKVEQDPVLSQFNNHQFENLIHRTILDLDFADDQKGIFKLKLLFAQHQNLCLKEIGVQSLDLKEEQRNALVNVFNAIDQFEYGKQRNITVNSQGILYITVQNGKVGEIRIVNFDLNEN